MISRLLVAVLVSLILTFSVFAQDSPEIPKARLIDEFGMIQFSDIMARLDNFAVELQNDPASTAMIIGYYGEESPVGKIIRNFNPIKTYLTRSRGLDPSRLAFIRKYEENADFKIQLWIVPAGAESPQESKSIENYLTNTKIARKFDEAYYAYNDLEYNYWDSVSFKEFSAFLKKEPDSIAYVILYPQSNKYGDENEKPVIRKDSARKTNLVIAHIKKNLRKAGIPLSKIKIVNGGYRDNRFIELWILPKEVKPPSPTPNQFP